MSREENQNPRRSLITQSCGSHDTARRGASAGVIRFASASSRSVLVRYGPSAATGMTLTPSGRV